MSNFEKKAQEYKKRWLIPIAKCDDNELSYIVGVAVKEIEKRGYLPRGTTEGMEKWVGDEFERRTKVEHEKS